MGEERSAQHERCCASVLNRSRVFGLVTFVATLLLVSIFLSLPLQAQPSTTVDVGYGSTPAIDGVIGLAEYVDAARVQFPCYGGTCLVYLQHDTTNLYVAFDSPDTTAYPYSSGGGTGPAVQVFLDTNLDKAASPQPDDLRLTLNKGNVIFRHKGSGTTWTGDPDTTGSTGQASVTAGGWQAEFSITFSKLGITPGTAKTIGLALANVWTKAWPQDFYWPSGAYYLTPSTWGEAYSSGNWNPWFFKAGGWLDYAPSGVPDFDQKQIGWTSPLAPIWSFCGPVAAANSLWWFDSKFEPSPIAPPVANDNYYLVSSYMPGADDHDPANVGAMIGPALVDDLAWYFDTDGIRTAPVTQGTEVHEMSRGLQWYLYGDSAQYPQWLSPFLPRWWSYYDDYHVQLVKQPTWDWVVSEVERSEDVVLLVGFWQLQDSGPAPIWVRVGGHYVTVAGVNATNQPPMIAFSDPFFDNAELGGPGRVLSGTILPHAPGHASTLDHNDAGNISHDYYSVILEATSPAGVWEVERYPPEDSAWYNFLDQNCPQEFMDQQGKYDAALPPPIAEVEYALAMSPFYWKPGGEWVDTFWHEEWITEFWRYEDDGDSCLPDFTWTGEDTFYQDGPVAVANSFWWFDSKAETLMTGGFPVAPPAISDHYSMVLSYDPSLFDDHDPQNTTLFVDDLAQNYLDTGPQGTTVASMTAGIDAYLARAGVAGDFYTATQDSPSWEWIADEVETCEDVVLLLGFYEETESGDMERKGGHWVNAAGVNRAGMFVGLSDPAIDHANAESISDTLHLGRVFPPERLGDPFTSKDKQYPQAISHDIYKAGASATEPGSLVLDSYPFSLTSEVWNYVGLNGGGQRVEDWDHRFETRVEWAIGVSPHSELIITKTAETIHAGPGDWITYTLHYSNTGLAAALSVVISDLLPLESLSQITYTASPPIAATPGVTYTWTLPRLSYGQSGTITITAQALITMFLENTATITGENAIGGPTPDRDPSNNTTVIRAPEWSKWAGGQVWTPGISLTVQPPDTLVVTDVVTSAHDISLVESWDVSKLTRLNFTASAGVLLDKAPGVVEWSVAVAQPEVMTLTKVFLVEPGTWTQTLLYEDLWVAGFEFDSRPVTITKPCIPLTAVSIDGDTSGPPGTYTFTTNYDPAGATPPITYLWDNGDVGPTSSRILGLGDHTLVVTATNCTTALVTDTHDIVISSQPGCVPIGMVDLTLASPAPIHAGSPAAFEADISPADADKPYSYRVDVDGVAGAAQTSSADPLLFTHTFAASGAHTVEIAVWNCSMTEGEAKTDTVGVTVYPRAVYLPIILRSH